jgi:glycosyltransferase involved in cell wall biosynthesis
LKVENQNIYVVDNTHSSTFNDKSLLNDTNENYIKLPPRTSGEKRLVLISHNYSHKNIKIIKSVIPHLTGLNIKFVLTISNNDYFQLFGDRDANIINLGPISQKSCPSVYSQSDFLFLPTLLEVFSASYPEAMKMKKPILTSKLGFAIDVCRDAAIYFNPLDPQDISKKITSILNDEKQQLELIQRGEQRLSEFNSANKRAQKYLDIIKSIIKTDKS